MEENEPDSKDKLKFEYSEPNKKFKFVFEGLGKTLWGVLSLGVAAWSIYKDAFSILMVIFVLLALIFIGAYVTIQKKC